ncbi:MAG: aldo/keto reductase [Chloroflexi bacterium]|nr:MAG: aldo/keto reductase [Chloroflexota bacterium]
MDYVTFGRTGLQVSVMGLGCGGPSRIGQSSGQDEAASIAIVRQALDAGVNFIDTAEAYRTETMVGAALAGVDRSKVVISTKKSYRKEIIPALVRQGLEESLRRLRTDYVDIYNLHGVSPADYRWLRDEILPTFFQLRDEGKIRFIGVSEMFNDDKTHQMLVDSLPDDVWDVVMVGFNILNQTARDKVFAQTQAQNVAVQIMFAVRRALSQRDKLVEALQILIDAGQLDPAEVDLNNPLGFVLEESDAASLVDAAYRFCRYEPGVHVVLSGTGNPAHLQANIESLSRPPLPEPVVQKLRYIFRNASAVTGQ